MTKHSRIRIVADANCRSSLAEQLQTHLSRRSLNSAFRAYTEAMISAQGLEAGLVLLLLFLRHERATQETLGEIANLHGYLFKRPLGNLFKLLKKEIPIAPQLETDLTGALDLRNFIAHRYFCERQVDWLLPLRLRRATKELKKIKTKFDSVSKEIDQLEECLCKKAKRTKEEVRDRIEKELLPSLVKVYALDRIAKRRRRSPPNKALQAARSGDG